MTTWKLVVFDEEDGSPTTYYVPGRSLESYRSKVDELIGDPENAEIVWQDLSRVGARYAEWSHATLVLIPMED